MKPISYGQVFTPHWLVEQMLALQKNVGRVLEPSCGSGAFSNHLATSDRDLVALELDPLHAPANAVVQDFFDLPLTERFATIIGNPPYVRYQDILVETKQKLDGTLFDRRTNLYLFFIEKSIRHLDHGGELIFVVPRDFPRATSAKRLNKLIFEAGTITDFWETGDSHVFNGATPPCCVFRFEKGRMNREMSDARVFDEHAGHLFFRQPGAQGVPLSFFFDVSVGGLSGADHLFTSDEGNIEVVCSQTARTGLTRKMLYGTKAMVSLAQHKPALLNRRVRRFSEINWWEWGRKWKDTSMPRIYVNAKTREKRPFFTHTCHAYDGSVLALFPKNAAINVELAVHVLNSLDWNDLGFMAGKRFIFAQQSLAHAMIPESVATELFAPAELPNVLTNQVEA